MKMKDRKTDTEVEWSYKKRCGGETRIEEAQERGDWKLDAPTPTREKAE